LCTKETPFDPTTGKPFHEQWTQFYKTHANTIREDILNILKIIFDFSDCPTTDLKMRQEEVREILVATSLETETDEMALDVEDEKTIAFADKIEDTKSLSTDSSKSTSSSQSL